MQIVRTVDELRCWSRSIRKSVASTPSEGDGLQSVHPQHNEGPALQLAEKLDEREGLYQGMTSVMPKNTAKSMRALAPEGRFPFDSSDASRFSASCLAAAGSFHSVESPAIIRIGLVPTMGALHAGHASLIHAARAACSHVVVSLFVNPTQFGPNEDFTRYPRSFEADCALAEAEGADILFAPSVEELYPNGPDSTFVEVPALSDRLDGQSRAGHFRGVATVVTKLLVAAEPDRAYFGQKDAAQVAILRRLVNDLRLATEIVVCPIVRDADGLALSSRNAYLTPAERARALTLSRVIRHVESLVAQGERHAHMLLASAHGFFAAERSAFAAEPAIEIDYVALVDWSTLEPVSTAAPGTLFALAAWVGNTRLIDNTILQ